MLRRKEPDAPRFSRVPGYPVVPAIFVLFATAFLVMSVYNDLNAYQAAVAAGRPGLINCALGTVLVLIGTPIYFFYRRRMPEKSDTSACRSRRRRRFDALTRFIR